MPNWRDNLDSGVYTIKSVDHSAYATLKDDDDPTTVRSEVFATGQATSKDRCWWQITKCDNNMYTIQNVHYPSHFVWRGGMNENLHQNPLQAASADMRNEAEEDDGIDDDIMWMFSRAPNGDFIIFSSDRSLCWQTNRSYHGKLQLGRYNASNSSSSQRWHIDSVDRNSGVSSSVRRVLSLDGCGIYGIAGLIVLHEVMNKLTAESEGTPTPSTVFDLVCGASSGGIIALLVGRFGLDCGNAMVQYNALMERLPSAQGCYIVPRCESYPRIISQIFQQFFGREGRLMVPSMNDSQSKHTNTIVTTARLEVSGSMPPQISGPPRASCIRSYQPIDHTYTGMDDVTTYTWPLEEAAIATCTPHPYSPPLQIRNNPQAAIPTLCHDPSLHGFSNPMNVAMGEAERLFADQHIVFISIGAGMIDEHSRGAQTKKVVKDNASAERAVMEAYQAASTHRAEETADSTMDAWSSPHHRLVRICPKFDPDAVDIQSHDSIRSATQTWMRSPEGQTQIGAAVQALLGHANPPVSHSPSVAGRSTERSDSLSPSVSSHKSSQHGRGVSHRGDSQSNSLPSHSPNPRHGVPKQHGAVQPPPIREADLSDHSHKHRQGHTTRKPSPSPDRHHQHHSRGHGSRPDNRSRGYGDNERPASSIRSGGKPRGGKGSDSDNDNYEAPHPPSRRHPDRRTADRSPSRAQGKHHHR